MKKILIIGDSFCRKTDWVKNRKNENKDFWIDILKYNLENREIIVNAQASRDIQTIIENWIRCIKYLNEDDFLFICLPYFRRSRLPLENKYYYDTKIENDIIYDRFVGTHSYSNKFESLEFWKMENDWKFYQEKLSYQEIINTTIANQITTIEVIESLIQLTKSHVFVFSWDCMDIKSKFIEDKNIITENIGMWETNTDVYNETNGEFGHNGDLHWSYKMHKLFGNHVLNRFFSNEKKIINII